MATRRHTFGPVTPETQSTDRKVSSGRRRHVLLIGEVDLGLRGDLASRGVQLTTGDTETALAELAERSFDVVVVAPFVEGTAADLIAVLKEPDIAFEHSVATLYGARGSAPFLRGVRPPDLATLVALRRKHRVTPFVVLPQHDSSWYSVTILVPQLVLRLNAKVSPLLTCILNIDSSAELGKLGAMA